MHEKEIVSVSLWLSLVKLLSEKKVIQLSEIYVPIEESISKAPDGEARELLQMIVHILSGRATTSQKTIFELIEGGRKDSE